MTFSVVELSEQEQEDDVQNSLDYEECYSSDWESGMESSQDSWDGVEYD